MISLNNKITNNRNKPNTSSYDHKNNIISSTISPKPRMGSNGKISNNNSKKSTAPVAETKSTPQTPTPSEPKVNKRTHYQLSNNIPVSTKKEGRRDSLDSINDFQDDQANQQAASTKPSTSASTEATTKKLPAIKFKINHQVVKKFSNPLTLSNEIIKHKGSIDMKKIKFASISNGNMVVIATDDKATHDILSMEWPTTAFDSGVYKVPPRKEVPVNILIKGVSTEISISELNQILGPQNLVNISRVTKTDKDTKQQHPTKLLKASVERKYLDTVLRGVKIGFTIYKVERDYKILQCFKCQKLGHTSASCNNKQVCVRCGEEHQHKECNNEVNMY